MKILFVGNSPQEKIKEFYKSFPNYDQLQTVFSERTHDFETFLNANFEEVDVVYGEDYQEKLSGNYDVTIFDVVPPKILNANANPMEWSVDKKSGLKTIIRERVLSESFQYPAVLIGETSGLIGNTINSHIDNLCICLGAHALNMNVDSKLFKTPNLLTPEYELRETPVHFKLRPCGKDLADTMKMCRIQKIDMEDDPKILPGAVSKGAGFNLAPDAEVFSGGSNAKGASAVALARHGCFFQWGFGVSPSYLTEFGQKLLVNSIYYIKNFNGAKQQTRRLMGIFTRSEISELFWLVGEEGYQKTAKNHIENMKNRQLMALDKKESGEELTPQDIAIIAVKEFPAPPRNPYLPRFFPGIEKELGDNWSSYDEYYRENEEYFWGCGENKFIVDEDIKSLKLSNRKLSTLDTLISLLEKPDSNKIANKLLLRYTSESFSTANEWRKWLNENKSLLHFSEQDGYIFVIINK